MLQTYFLVDRIISLLVKRTADNLNLLTLVVVVLFAICISLQGFKDYQLLVQVFPQVIEQAITSEKELSINELLVVQMFGTKEITESEDTKNLEDIPETRLDLELKGVFASNNHKLSGALIADSNRGQDRYYRVGDKLPGDVKLVQVFSKAVTLNRRGVLESLKLEELLPVRSQVTEKKKNDIE